MNKKMMMNKKLTIECSDENEFRLHLDGPRYKSALYEIVTALREKKKYSEENGSWDEAFLMVIGLLNDSNIDVFSE